MAWVRIDDQARSHRKVLSAGAAGAWLWICGLMYCNSQKARDGFIPEEAVAVLYPIPGWRREAARLVTIGLWERVTGGYLVHDYHDYQPSAEDAERIREQRAIAGRIGGTNSGKQRRSKPEANDEAKPKHVGAEATKPVPDPVPIPIPNTSGVLSGVAVESAPSGVRTTKKSSAPHSLRADFVVSQAIEAMARKEGLPNPHDVLPDFRDWALGENVRKVDWEATFRRWMRDDRTRRRYPKWAAADVDLPVLRLDNRDELLREDFARAETMTGFSLGATK